MISQRFGEWQILPQPVSKKRERTNYVTTHSSAKELPISQEERQTIDNFVFTSELPDIIAQGSSLPFGMYHQFSDIYVTCECEDKKYILQNIEGKWECDCNIFARWQKIGYPGYEGFCPHVYAWEKFTRENI